MTLDIPTISSELADLCRAYHIRRLSLFGSAVRGELRPESDIDLLADFAPDHAPSYFELVKLSDQLSPLFGGRTIDLVTPGGLHPLFRPEFIRQAKVVYEG
jgi:predicted nucleotidyltransferase